MYRGKACHDLADPRVTSTGLHFHCLQQFNFVLVTQTRKGIGRGIQWWRLCVTPLHRRSRPAAFGNGTRSIRRLGKRRQYKFVRVGKTSFLTANRTQTDSLISAAAARFNGAVLQCPTLLAAVLEIKISIVDILTEQPTHQLIDVAGIKTSGV